MGVSIHIDRAGVEGVVIPVAGSNEIRDVWSPIISAEGLGYLDHATDAGLRVEQENYAAVVEEVVTLLAKLSESRSYCDDIVNPVFRCQRLLNLLLQNPPGPQVSVYIG